MTHSLFYQQTRGEVSTSWEKYITSQKSMDNDQTYKLVLTNQQPKVINQVKQTVGPIATTNKMIRRNGLNHQIGQQ